jgi:hypothetical protein
MRQLDEDNGKNIKTLSGKGEGRLRAALREHEGSTDSVEMTGWRGLEG